MKKRVLFFSIVTLLFSSAINAREIAGIRLNETIQLSNKSLQLNGAGIRTKFVFDIYVGALYLAEKTQDPKQAINMPGPKRVMMHFLYDEVEKEKLTDGWTDGFENNLDDKQLADLKSRLDQFNEMFITVKNGDVILLDYIPGKGTHVTINKKLTGTVQGEDFYQALLKVWLGDDPADEDLKSGMLGNL